MKKIISFLLCLLTLLCACPAQAAEHQAVSQSILDYNLQSSGASSVQAWIDGALSETAGLGAEWYVIALSQSGSYDFSSYERSLLRYLNDTTVHAAVSRQKFALSLRAAGSADPWIASVTEDSIGQQGVMSWVFGLHLLHNGYESSSVTVDSAAAALLSMQLEDGGWAISGTVSDVDVTAMAVQALAPCLPDSSVAAAVDRAVELLSLRQREDGGFASYGTPNPESAAQVLVALSALGADALADDRFIKNGRTVLDGMTLYQLPDGSFSHTLGGASNAAATVQVFYALTAYQRMLEGKPGILLLDRPAAEAASPALRLGYKPIAALIIAFLALASCLALLLLKKRSPKNYIAVLVIAAALTGFVFATDFQSAEGYYTSQPIVKENPVGTVTLSILCDTAVAQATLPGVPADGVILAETAFAIEQGDTVYDILTQAARTHSIHMESGGAPGMRYISGISHLYELALGDLSGWLYFVNGESASQSCDQYALRDGDKILWRYTLEMGNDLT